MILRNKLFWQMFLTASFAAISAALVIYVTVQSQIESKLQSKVEASLDSQLHFASLVALDAFTSDKWSPDPKWLESLANSDTRMSLINADGEVVFDSKHALATLDNHRNRPEILEAAKLGKGKSERFSLSLGTNLIYAAYRIDHQDKTLGFVRLAFAVSLLEAELYKLQQQLLLVIFVTLLLLFIVSYLLSQKFYQPISAATHYAKRVADGHYSQRLPGVGVDEVAVLERSLNELARKTQERLGRVVASHNEVNGILSGLKEGVVALDKNENIVHINRAAHQLLGISADVVGLKIWEVIRSPKIHGMIEAAVQQHHQIERELVVADRTLDLEVIALDAEKGSIGSIILVFQDVTERILLDRMRSDFVANTSHELKTPLAALKGMAETIIDDGDMPTTTIRQFVKRMLSQANRLNKIVLDLMHLSKFEGYQEQGLRLADVDLVRFMEHVCQEKRVLAQAVDVQLEIDCTMDQQLLLCDEEAMSQLMSNLIENAIRYSPSGARVLVVLRKAADSLIFSVADNGIGIAKNEQSRIFERFYRVDAARSRDDGGTGLGLAIVKYAVEAHQGTIKIDSEIGRGTIFTVRFPLHEI